MKHFLRFKCLIFVNKITGLSGAQNRAPRYSPKYKNRPQILFCAEKTVITLKFVKIFNSFQNFPFLIFVCKTIDANGVINNRLGQKYIKLL